MNEMVQPLGFLAGQGDRMITGSSRQDKPGSFPCRLADRLSAEPHEPPFCLGMIVYCAMYEQALDPGWGHPGFRDWMLEPVTNIQRESLSFQIIEHRPPESFAQPLRCGAATIPVPEIVFCKSFKCRSENA